MPASTGFIFVSVLAVSDDLLDLLGGRFEDDSPFRFLSFFSLGVVVVLVLRCIDKK